MRFEDFIIEFQRQEPAVVINLHKTYCSCHWKEVWVADTERLPYLCERRKELPAGGKV